MLYKMVDQDKPSTMQQNFLPTKVVRSSKHIHVIQVGS